ncbi:hypothetical protein [Burkholderia anthina]|uniref:hypothetical protein n=1 Tax=Burkholderia anthina TaxID=179879 RepID=UPI00158AE693|nr:hypothetical protein [Burkholderia anthina]
MSTAILLLNDLSYQLGIIGLAELTERAEMADWLLSDGASQADPRGAPETERVHARDTPDDPDALSPSRDDMCSADTSGNANEAPRWLEFLALGRWHFTLGDVDCVPSVPHGHQNSKTQSWPKLNPYTGRVFVGVNQEDATQRLDRIEMLQLWRDDKFIEHCRKQVLWYTQDFPSYPFANARRGRLVFPRW